MKYNLILKKTFFYDLVKNKEKINNLNSIELNRFSISNYSQFEQEVENFILESEKKFIPITYEIIKNEFEFNIYKKHKIKQNISFSYIQNFLKRAKLKNIKVYGESKLQDEVFYLEEIKNIRNKLKTYKLKNIFNYDETALFYQCLLNSAIGSKNFKGFKNSKKRITKGLCVNYDGS